jgi:hypothetical protein
MEVVCINNIGKQNITVPLTIGKRYHIKYGYVVDSRKRMVKKEIKQDDKVIYYFLLNPDTDVILFSPKNFVTTGEWRQIQLDKII